MKVFASLASIVLSVALAACGSNNDCQGNDCVCTGGQACTETCAPGSPCHVQCAPGQPCDVGCVAGENCHVECEASTSCKVDCAMGTDCHVTCPASGCTVRNISPADTAITCGAIGTATITGSTATCP